MNAYVSRETLPTSARAVAHGLAILRTRYRDAAVSWIALGALLAAWHVEARLERHDATAIDPRLAAEKAVPAGYSEIRTVRADARSWMARGPRGLRTR
jgi:hypothetical protein